MYSVSRSRFETQSLLRHPWATWCDWPAGINSFRDADAVQDSNQRQSITKSARLCVVTGSSGQRGAHWFSTETATELWLAPWTEAELQAARSLITPALSTKGLQDRFFHLGGNMHAIVADAASYHAMRRRVAALLPHLRLQDLARAKSLSPWIIHPWPAHATSGKPGKDCEFSFASSWIQDELMQQWGDLPPT